MEFIIIAFLFLLGLLLLALISFPILPDSIRASGYTSVVLVCLKKWHRLYSHFPKEHILEYYTITTFLR